MGRRNRERIERIKAGTEKPFRNPPKYFFGRMILLAKNFLGRQERRHDAKRQRHFEYVESVIKQRQERDRIAKTIRKITQIAP